MELTASQTDALTELINIGYARAAAALSELTGHRISLEVPEVAVHQIPEIAESLQRVVQGDVVSVNQVFSRTDQWQRPALAGSRGGHASEPTAH